VVLSDCNSPIR